MPKSSCVHGTFMIDYQYKNKGEIMSFPFEVQHICVKSRTGTVWFATDSSSFYSENSSEFHKVVEDLNNRYPDLEFAILLYDNKRNIAPKKYRPWTW